MQGQEMTPVGVVRNPIHEAVDDVWAGLISRIEFDTPQFTDASLAGLEEFSHVEVIFVFDRVNDGEIEHGARHPRGRKDWPLIGILRSAERIVRIGWE